MERRNALCAAVPVSLAIIYGAVGWAFARHATRVVFNRNAPPSLTALRSLLGVTRPLQIAWRALTAPLRCPAADVYILGEVRCGTTTLASLLRDRLGMVGPFSPWDHPLANDKESFYFVGHYWGVVSLMLYRLCFPLRVQRWWRRVADRKPMLLFDGCASHFAAPWVAAQLGALHSGGRGARRRPLLIVCVREPVAQHLSWWRLERGAMSWGDAMGLSATYLGAPAREAGYPPDTLDDAVRLSRSSVVRRRWSDAEALPLAGGVPMLPDWAVPFPNGQLSAFDQMGRYADNLQRWRRHFDSECVLVVELDEMARDPERVLRRIQSRCEALFDDLASADRRALWPPDRGSGGDTADEGAAPKLNASARLPDELEPSAASLRALAAYYRPHNERLEQLVGRSFGWHERYWYYHAEQPGGIHAAGSVHAVDMATGVRPCDVARYAADGVVVLRAALGAAEVAALRAAIEAARAAPAGFSGRMGEHGGWTLKFLWRSEPAVRHAALHSRLARAVAELLETRKTNLLYDHVCVKEPGDTAPTSWHHDINYLPVEPPDAFASAWVALDDVGASQGRLEFVRGSHRWRHADGTTRRFTPMDFPTMAAVADEEWVHPENPQRRGFEALPDIEGARGDYDIVSTDVRSGDVLVFHGLTLHHSPGNADPHRRRRAISLRYTGEAAVYTPRRKGIASGWPPPGPEALLRPGEPLTCPIWPLAFDADASRREE